MVGRKGISTLIRGELGLIFELKMGVGRGKWEKRPFDFAQGRAELDFWA